MTMAETKQMANTAEQARQTAEAAQQKARVAIRKAKVLKARKTEMAVTMSKLRALPSREETTWCGLLASYSWQLTFMDSVMVADAATKKNNSKQEQSSFTRPPSSTSGWPWLGLGSCSSGTISTRSPPGTARDV